MNCDGDDRRVFALAMGRILKLGSRPEQPGDAAEYERCRAVILALPGAADVRPDWEPNCARDRGGGAAGD